MNSSVIIVRCGLGLTALLLMSCSTAPKEVDQPVDPIIFADPVEPTQQVDPGVSTDAPETVEVAPEAQVSASMTLNDARQVQSQVMDFADEMTLRLTEAIDEIENTAQTLKGRTIAHRLKYTVAHGATIIASAQNPRIALVDMYVMITLQRALIE